MLNIMVCLLPVQDFIAAVEDVRLGVMVGTNQLVSKRLKSSNFLLLWDPITFKSDYSAPVLQYLSTVE